MPSSKQMVEAANAVVPRITPAEAQKLMAQENTLVVDVRDAPGEERQGRRCGQCLARPARVSRRSGITLS